MCKWHHYLVGSTLTIKIDHWNLWDLLDQSIQTLEQEFFLTKLLGYSYVIAYKKGMENGAADALSRLMEGEDGVQFGELATMTCFIFSRWLECTQS